MSADEEISKSDLVEIFGFSEEDQHVFPYTRVYMSLVSPELDNVVGDPERVLRFALAGLSILFFASVHHGDDFDTVVENWHGTRDSTLRKLEKFNLLYEGTISSSSEYIETLFEGPSLNLNGEDLFRFVMDGKKIPNRLG